MENKTGKKNTAICKIQHYRLAKELNGVLRDRDQTSEKRKRQKGNAWNQSLIKGGKVPLKPAVSPKTIFKMNKSVKKSKSQIIL